ncbi:hypothetical protein [Rummeliibacillus sp. BSL5]
MTERFSAVVGASIKDFLAKMREVHSTLKKTTTGANADIGANVRAFNAKMTLVRANLKQVEYAKSEAKISADISSFNRTMAILKAKMLAISGSKVVARIKADWSNFRAGWQAGQAMIGKIATSMRNFGEIVSTSLQGAFIAVLPAISPIIANLGGLIGSLGPIIGTVAGSTFALVGAFAAAGSAAAAFGMVAIPTIKALFEKNAKLNAEQQKAKSAFDSLKATYTSLVAATEKPVLSAFTKAMGIAKTLLIQLKPLFVQSAQAVDFLMGTLKKSIGTPPVQKFLEYLNKNGAPMLVTFGAAFGNVFQGITSMLTAFAPLSASTAGGFLDMTKSFADWAAGLDKSKKFQTFMDYVQTNMPKLKSIVGDAIIGVVNTFAAFGPMSANMMSALQSMMSKFREWSASLSKSEGFKKFCDYVIQTAPSVMALIGNLTTFLINLGVGMAPLGAKLLELTNRFLSWTDNMMKAHPVIGRIIAGLTTLIGVVMATLPWILSVGTSLIRMVAPGTTANAILTKVGQVIANVGIRVISLASKALPWLVRSFGLLTGPVGATIAIIASLISIGVALYKNWDTIKVKASELSTAVVTKVTELTAKAIAKFVELRDKAVQRFNELKTKAISKVAELTVQAVTKFNDLKTKATAKVAELATQAVSKFTSLKTKASSKVSELKTAVVSRFSELKSSAVSKVQQLATSAVSKFSQLKSSAANKVSEMKIAVANKFSEMVSSVGNKMNEVKSKVESGWNRAKSFLSGINLVSIGAHIIQGLINGIQSKIGAVISTAKSIASKVTSTIKKAMDIHSPSRVTYALGEYTGQGYANGIRSKSKTVSKSAKSIAATAKKAFNDGMRGLDLKLQAGSITTSTYVAQAKALGNKYKTVTNAQNVVAAKIRKATTSQALKAQRERHAKQMALQKEFNNKMANLNNKYAAGKINESQYIKSLNAMKSKYSSVTNAISKIDVKIAQAKIKQLKEQFENDKAYYDKKLNTGKLTAAREVEILTDLSKKYKKNSEERVYFEQLAAEKKKAIYDKLISLNDEYTTKIQEANQKLIDGEKALNEEYAKAVADRANTIKNFVGLFDEIPEAAEVSGQQLKSNLQSQVETIRTWSENMASLASKGIDEGLLAELQAMGPGAASQIAAMNTLSDTELQEYVALWQEKSTLATQIATNELVDLRLETNKQIEQLKKETKAQLAQYKSEWQVQIKELTGKTTNQFNALTASMPAIGKNVIKGMQQGLSDMTPALLSQAQSIADSIKATIQKSLDIHSPSRWGRNFIGKNLVLGMINGIRNMQSKAVSTALELAEEVKAGMAAGLTQKDVLGYTANATSSINKELNVKVKVELEGDGNNGKGNTTVNQEVHLHSPRELSPSENARQMKKQAQKLAQEWG